MITTTTVEIATKKLLMTKTTHSSEPQVHRLLDLNAMRVNALLAAGFKAAGANLQSGLDDLQRLLK